MSQYSCSTLLRYFSISGKKIRIKKQHTCIWKNKLCIFILKNNRTHNLYWILISLFLTLKTLSVILRTRITHMYCVWLHVHSLLFVMYTFFVKIIHNIGLCRWTPIWRTYTFTIKLIGRKKINCSFILFKHSNFYKVYNISAQTLYNLWNMYMFTRTCIVITKMLRLYNEKKLRWTTPLTRYATCN